MYTALVPLEIYHCKLTNQITVVGSSDNTNDSGENGNDIDSDDSGENGIDINGGNQSDGISDRDRVIAMTVVKIL